MAYTKKVSEKKDVPSADVEGISDETPVVKRTKKATVKDIADNDIIEIESVIPNVYYTDEKNGDRYVWKETGDIEEMPFAAVKDMWRNHKGYFTKLKIRPLDDRVIKKFGLEKLYKTFGSLCDANSYAESNAEETCKTILSIGREYAGVKETLYTKIKSMVSSGEITDIRSIRILENRLGIMLLDSFG